MRDRVGERDRHEARDEHAVERDLGARKAARHVRGQQVEPADRGDDEEQPGDVEERPLDVPLLEPPVHPRGRAAEAVEGDRAEHHGHERDRPGPGLAQPGEADERRAQAHLALLHGQRRDAGDEAEVDGERVRLGEPLGAAVEERADPGVGAVDEDRERERARVGRVVVGELERREGEQPDRGRPAAEALRIGERLRTAAPAAAEPLCSIRGGLPRVDRRPDVPEERRNGGEAEPEDDVDERRREVPELGALAHEPGREDEQEQEDRDDAERDPQAAREHEAQPRERAPAAVVLQHGAAPQERERHERHDDHGPRAVEEEPLRNRQVPDGADPVREEAHRKTAEARTSGTGSGSPRAGRTSP